MIILDSSVLYALLDAADGRHEEAATWYAGVDRDLATTPLVLAEVDHFVTRQSDERAVAAFRADLVGGAYAVEWWDGAASTAAEIAHEYRGLRLGLTDASLVALAAISGTTEIATFDQRHFRAVRPRAGRDAFTLLPADA